jgi:CHAT domain-containing protein
MAEQAAWPGTSVARLSRLDLPGAALAYLSACATSQTSAGLADEAVHVTSAFQIAGYAQVIGTLWPAGDKISSEMARSIYASLRTPALGSTRGRAAP